MFLKTKNSCNNPPTCENGGFLNHNCGCYCPSGLIGSTCNTVQSSSGCGGIITLSSGVEQTITSPNYPNNYDTGVDCVWLIKAPSNEHVQLTIDFMDIADNGFDACYHWLEIRYNLLGQSGPELCGIRNAENYYTTSDELKNEMLIKFNSAVSSDRAPKKGFQLTVRSIGVYLLHLVQK
ncbi:blastula protease 10-like [Saccostrea echinata]|uniref:blastula protease 10-like n=1 Tax=Saccostrea echinata TaxID=191078 RepID=UPI002A807EF3|nr:blastula protease 10-like [Saccostrea echinata]